MGTIHHHLNDALLMGYSAGTLPEAFSLVVATHISLCDECRARLESYDAVGGAVMEDCAVPDVASCDLAATLARIASLPDDMPAPRVTTGDAIFPSPLQDYVGGDLDAVRWRGVGGGVRQAILTTSKDASVRLLYIPGGTEIPDHGHRGTELTLVLQGAFRDGDARFGRGDVEIANEDLHHTPIAEDGPACICLAACDARLKFSGILPRIAQPFLRI